MFARLGMTPVESETGLSAADPQGYSRFALGPARPSTPLARGWPFGSAELAMTAADLARWDVSVIDRSVMSPAAYTAQQTEEVLKSGLGTNYGLGVDVHEAGGRRRIKHGEGHSGFSARTASTPTAAPRASCWTMPTSAMRRS